MQQPAHAGVPDAEGLGERLRFSYAPDLAGEQDLSILASASINWLKDHPEFQYVHVDVKLRFPIEDIDPLSRKYADWVVTIARHTQGTSASLLFLRPPTPISQLMFALDSRAYVLGQLSPGAPWQPLPTVTPSAGPVTVRCIYSTSDREAIGFVWSLPGEDVEVVDIRDAQSPFTEHRGRVDIAVVSEQRHLDALLGRAPVEVRPTVAFVGGAASRQSHSIRGLPVRHWPTTDAARAELIEIRQRGAFFGESAVVGGLSHTSGAPEGASLVDDVAGRLLDTGGLKPSHGSGSRRDRVNPIVAGGPQLGSRPTRLRWFIRGLLIFLLLSGIVTLLAFRESIFRRFSAGPDAAQPVGPPLPSPPAREPPQPAPVGELDRAHVFSAMGRLPAVCRTLSPEHWRSLRLRYVYQLGFGRAPSPSFQRGRRTTIGALLTREGAAPMPSVIVFGQLSCQPCMDELPLVASEARTYASAVFVAEILLENEWNSDQDNTPYDPGYAARLVETSLPFAAADRQGSEAIISDLGEDPALPAFLYLNRHGEAERICFGAVAIPTPEGREFTQWISRAALRRGPASPSEPTRN